MGSRVCLAKGIGQDEQDELDSLQAIGEGNRKSPTLIILEILSILSRN